MEMSETNWVQCDQCDRFEMYENTGIKGKFDSAAIAKKKFICRLCNMDLDMKEIKEENANLKCRLTAAEGLLAVKNKSYSDMLRVEIEKDRAELKSELVGLVQSTAAAGSEESQSKVVEKLVAKAVAIRSDEDFEVERRKKNIIVYRVEESSSAEPETRKAADTSFFKDLFEGPLALGQVQDSMTSIIRLGRRAENNSVRPMLIKLRSEEVKSKFMAALKRLKGAEDRFKRISVAHDLTVNQRAAVKEAVTKAKQDTDTKPQSGNWVYRVTNHQRNPRVTRIQR